MINYTRKTVRGAGIIFIISIIAAFFGYVTRLLIARNLTVEEYGLFYAVMALILFIGLFKDFGLGVALAKFIAEFKVKREFGQIKSIIVIAAGSQILISIIIAALLIIFSKVIAEHYFHNIFASQILVIFALVLVARSITKLIGRILQGFQDMVKYAFVDIARTGIILAIIIIGFIFVSKSLLIPSLAYLVAPFILLIIFLPALLSKFKAKVKMNINRELIKKMFTFGIPVMIGTAGAVVMGYTDTLMLTFFSGLQQVGLYNAAMPTARLLTYFSSAVAAVVLPFASQLWTQKKYKVLSNGIELTHVYLVLIILPFALIMFSFPELILSILFGAEYGAAAIVLKILSLGIVFLAIATIGGQALSGIGKPKVFTKIILIVAGINVALNFVLIQMYGFVGAAIATVTCYVLMFVLVASQLGKFIKFKLPLVKWAKTLFVALVLIGLSYWLKSWLVLNVWLEVAIILSILAAVYCGLVFLLRITTLEEIRGIVRRVLD